MSTSEHVADTAEERARGRRGDGFDWDYWFDRETWSSFMTFLLLTGALVVIALPFSMDGQQIRDTESKLSDLFPTVYVLLFGIVAISLGQAEIMWEHRLSDLSQFVHLASRILLALGLTIPFWVVFLMGTSQSPLMVVPVILHLALLGIVLGIMGWRLALTQFSEIFQFNVKYLSFFAFLIITFFYGPVRFLNPIWPLQEMASQGISLPGPAAFAYYAAWIAAGTIIGYFVHSRLNQDLEERDEHGYALS